MFEAERRRREYIDRLESFAFETVFSHPGKLKEIQRAREGGYFVRLVFVGLESLQLSIARVRRWMACGGHNVLPDKIPGRYEQGLNNVAKAVRLVDEAVIWDNSAEDEAPTEVIEFREGRTSTKFTALLAWLRDCLGEALLEDAPCKTGLGPGKEAVQIDAAKDAIADRSYRVLYSITKPLWRGQG